MLKIELKNIYILYVVSIDVCGIDRHTSVFLILHTHRSQSRWLL